MGYELAIVSSVLDEPNGKRFSKVIFTGEFMNMDTAAVNLRSRIITMLECQHGEMFYGFEEDMKKIPIGKFALSGSYPLFTLWLADMKIINYWMSSVIEPVIQNMGTYEIMPAVTNTDLKQLLADTQDYIISLEQNLTASNVIGMTTISLQTQVADFEAKIEQQDSELATLRRELSEYKKTARSTLLSAIDNTANTANTINIPPPQLMSTQILNNLDNTNNCVINCDTYDGYEGCIRSLKSFDMKTLKSRKERDELIAIKKK